MLNLKQTKLEVVIHKIFVVVVVVVVLLLLLLLLLIIIIIVIITDIRDFHTGQLWPVQGFQSPTVMSSYSTNWIGHCEANIICHNNKQQICVSGIFSSAMPRKG